MKRVIITLLIILPFYATAQKAKVDYDKETNQVSVNGVNSFRIVKVGSFTQQMHFDVFDSTGKKVIIINYRQFNSPVEISKSNPDGTVRYYEFVFIDSKKKAEVDYFAVATKKVARKVVEYNLIVDGKLNEQAVDEFVLSKGTPYAERVKF